MILAVWLRSCMSCRLLTKFIFYLRCSITACNIFIKSRLYMAQCVRHIVISIYPYSFIRCTSGRCAHVDIHFGTGLVLCERINLALIMKRVEIAPFVSVVSPVLELRTKFYSFHGNSKHVKLSFAQRDMATFKI